MPCSGVVTKRLSIGVGVVIAALLSAQCKSTPQGPPVPATGWDAVKRQQTPHCDIATEFGAPERQPLATLAWEDGLYISRDGLALYCTYVECDLFKFLTDGLHFEQMWRYKRGPDIHQDLANPLPGHGGEPWCHGDVAMSVRASKNVPFGPWKLSKLHDKFFNLGGAVGIARPGHPEIFDYFAYTDDSRDGVKIKLMRNVGRELADTKNGVWLPDNVDNQQFHEDNPHIERPDPIRPNHLVLFFDCDNRPGSTKHRIYYTMSEDGGTVWSNPVLVSSVTQGMDEMQPHLFQSRGQWWLYLAAMNAADGKLAIFRYKQGTPGDWNSWKDKELVVDAGTAAAVGEPTLTDDGDLSFVVVTVNRTGGTDTDMYDCDPWIVRGRSVGR
jgi:hypothetical protein